MWRYSAGMSLRVSLLAQATHRVVGRRRQSNMAGRRDPAWKVESVRDRPEVGQELSSVAGSDASPIPGSWGGIRVSGGVADLRGVDIRYAAKAVSASNYGDVTLRGTLRQAHSGVVADSESFVDASDVDWGSASGPAPRGSGTSVQGPPSGVESQREVKRASALRWASSI